MLCHMTLTTKASCHQRAHGRDGHTQLPVPGQETGNRKLTSRTPAALQQGGGGAGRGWGGDLLGELEARTEVASGEVHGPQGVVVDLHRLGQRLRVPAVALARDVAALSTGGTSRSGRTQTPGQPPRSSGPRTSVSARSL